eukprot:904348-Pelagomonas_calceolata.AAC.7
MAMSVLFTYTASLHAQWCLERFARHGEKEGFGGMLTARNSLLSRSPPKQGEGPGMNWTVQGTRRRASNTPLRHEMHLQGTLLNTHWAAQINTRNAQKAKN